MCFLLTYRLSKTPDWGVNVMSNSAKFTEPTVGNAQKDRVLRQRLPRRGSGLRLRGGRGRTAPEAHHRDECIIAGKATIKPSVCTRDGAFQYIRFTSLNMINIAVSVSVQFPLLASTFLYRLSLVCT